MKMPAQHQRSLFHSEFEFVRYHVITFYFFCQKIIVVARLKATSACFCPSALMKRL
jgi:hypothetical protein